MHPVSRRTLLGGTAALTAASALAACSNGSSGGGSSDGIYFLNFKPESESAFKEIAKTYQDAKGVEVKVVTAASGTYEQTLKSEVAKSNPPTLFQMNGPIGLANWKDYATDMSETETAKALIDPSMGLKGEDGKIYGLPLANEGYGLIYNAAILNKYFTLPGAKVASIDEVKGFDALKALAEDMQTKKDQLGIKGVFASTSLAPGEDWRWHTHLANYPLFYELRDENATDTKAFKMTYGDQYKQIFDLYLNNSTVPKTETSAKTVTDSMSEFALGQAAFVQNGNWAWSQISEVDGNTVKEEDIRFMPIYIGVEGEENSGIAIGTENYLTINSKASEAAQKATGDFLTWLFTDPEGSKLAAEKLGIIAPYTAFAELAPEDPLGKQVSEFMNNKDLYPINWVFQIYPSQDFKDQFGQHLSQYASGKEDWAAVIEYVTTEWAAEKA